MNSSIELIRLIAVILIVFTHTRNDLEKGVAYFIIEKIPTFGTAILSIVSGYLYYKVSRRREKLFQKKIKSLVVPYLIANLSVLTLVVLLNYIFGYNALNRLAFDSVIITDGIFALNSVPINPPTYFIRDIFILFSFIALFTQKELKALLIIIPFMMFGTLILRLDVAFLFLTGVLYAKVKDRFKKIYLVFLLVLLTFISAVYFPDYLKFPVTSLIFVLLVDIQFNFFNTGKYSYLLHLYHSPIIVVSYPLISIFIQNYLLRVIAQIIIALASVYVIFLIVKRVRFLGILTGNR
ncbi:MAG: hypothetical protein CSA32_01375 [Desulfobulbus propionicus]|nr:MAG: hypothetical protein CSA32_01375 [Desulfobulbus propionicus]